MKKAILRSLCMFLTLLLLVSFTGPAARAAGVLDTIDTRSLAMINKPGVVLIQTVWTADITFSEFDFTDDFGDDLIYAIADMVERGEIPNTEQAMYSAMVQLMIENMSYYTFYTGNVSTERASTAAVGTGFIITPDGYLITNAHVVETNEEELYMDFAMSTLENYAIEGTNSFVEEMRRQGYQMSQQEIDGMMYAFYDLLAYSMDIDNLQTSYLCYMGNVTPGSDVSTRGFALDLRKMGASIPGKDVAILKLDKANLPTVTLGDDSRLRTGDKVYAMGYPAVATINDALNVAQAIQEPTLTGGMISARKEMSGGWSILQTDAAIHGGNSGGPLFNEDGEVIGINTFGMLDPNSGAQVAGMNFAIPISVAKQFLNEINVTPTESPFTTQYKRALTHFQAKEFDQALELLRGLNETNPGYPVVADLLAESRTLADQQPKPTPTAEPAPTPDAVPAVAKPGTMQKGEGNALLSNPIVWGLGGLLLVLIVVVIILLTRKKPALAPAAPSTKAVTTAASPAAAPSPAAAHTDACPHCGVAAPAGSKFCNECGNAIPAPPSTPTHCPNCGGALQSGAKFCNECGTKVGSGT